MKLQLIKYHNGAAIYHNSKQGKYFFEDGMDENHCPILSDGFNTIEECEQAANNFLESLLF